jgi:imidazolonepropionase-like amidohydrolase
MRRLRYLILILIVLLCAAYLIVVWPLRDPHPLVHLEPGALAVRDARVYTSPDAAPMEHGSVVVRDGLITAVAPDATIPADARVLPCGRCVVVAGFWNVHVHFTEPKWSWAAFKPASILNAQLADMLTSRGFTTIADVGSEPGVTLSLRRRIESGELLGPRIYTAGSAIFPPHGIPYYLKNTMPSYLLWLMPQPETPAEAARSVESNIARGADLLKLFTGSYIGRGNVLPMPEPIARAAVEVAHRHHQLAFSHASNLAGTQVAIAARVDVLAHAPDSPDGIDETLLRTLVERRMGMIPTLKMFATTVSKNAAYLQPIYNEVRKFHELGGQLLFGTDVGYMHEYSTEDEFRALARSGLNGRDILRMLTTAPAERFGVAHELGTLAPARRGDFVILDRDPMEDVSAFASVRCTVRHGRVLYTRR